MPLWYQAAAIWLEAGDQDAYRRNCQEMLRRFGETDDPTIAERTAKICMLIPVASADLPPRVRLAERAVTGTEKHKYYRYFLLVRALAHYRAENSTAPWRFGQEPRAGSQGLRPQARVPCLGDGTSPTGPAGRGRTGPEQGPRDDGAKRVSEGRQRRLRLTLARLGYLPTPPPRSRDPDPGRRRKTYRDFDSLRTPLVRNEWVWHRYRPVVLLRAAIHRQFPNHPRSCLRSLRF